eukprot:5916357-Amphidinium_carterae.1
MVHQRKKIGGKWVRPKYVQRTEVTLEDVSTLKLYKGTQLIDGLWKCMRTTTIYQCRSLQSDVVESFVRLAQWRMCGGNQR